MSAIIFQIQSILIVSLLIFGVYKRKSRFQHMKIMKLAIIWDLLLVAQIELSRGAIATASNALANPKMLNIHVSLAITSVVLYAIVWRTGSKIAKGHESYRPMHKILGALTLTCRIATLITSYLIVTKG